MNNSTSRIKKSNKLTIIIILSSIFLFTGFQLITKNSNELSSDLPPVDSPNKPKVSILGVFHFGGSSTDMASMHLSDPFGELRQKEIKEVVKKLQEYKPTKILVEFPKDRQDLLDTRFEKYLNSEDTLRVSETEQLGFRLAENLNHSKLYAIDYKLDLPSDGLFEYCQRHDKMSEFENFVKEIQAYVANENKFLDTMSIASYLARTNNDEIDGITNDVYIGNILSWGDSISEAGAKFASTWWERNFVILKNIAKTIDHPEDRILVILGSGHRAVLKNLVIDRRDMEYVEIGEYLN